VRSRAPRGAGTACGGALHCHCKRCQRRTGSAFSVTALTTPGSFEITRGEDAVRSWQPAGDGWVKSFCSSCGSQAYTSHPDNPELISVRMGALDEDPGIRPSPISSSTTPLPGTAFRMMGFPVPERLPAGEGRLTRAEKVSAAWRSA
jgi:hypothetical protein